MRKARLAAAVLALLPAAPAAAQAPPDPAFLPTAIEQWPKARERGLDQATHPELQAQLDAARVAAVDSTILGDDPYRRTWAPARGTETPFAFANRYGATLRGKLYAPPGVGRHPGVVVLTGGFGPEVSHRELSQGLAEAGYLVLALQAQGDVGSDAAPADPIPSTPENERCKPYDFGGWQGPQELGIRETGTCAGGFEPDAGLPVTDPTLLPGYYRELLTDTPDLGAIEADYEARKARKAFGALDAIAWMRSKDNPLRDRLAGGKLGIVGYSYGSHGALLAGHASPHVGAIVSLDGFGRLAPTTEPRVPTLFFQHEIDRGLPKQRALDASVLPAFRDAEAFRAAGVRTGVVVPDASTHADFSWTNFPLVWPLATALGVCPECTAAINATRDGLRVVQYYTQAWLDRELRGASRDALHVATFPASADASSIGQGRWDPATRRNVPYTIGGERVADKLSPLLPSFVDGCADLRKGC
jgi:dienelactone hydrolase